MVNKHLHKICIIDFRPMFLNTDDPFACARLKSQKDAASAISDIFIMFFLGTSRGLIGIGIIASLINCHGLLSKQIAERFGS